MSMTLPEPLLRQYKRGAFVETGTHEGGGVRKALQVGFTEIHSVEVDPATHAAAVRNVGGLPGVYLALADCLDWLPGVVPKLTSPSTFWLDGHFFPDGKPRRLGRLYWPLLEELKIIRDLAVRKDHVILIDDRLSFEGMFEIPEREVRKLLLEINPAYQITYADSLYRPQDIMIAVLP